MEKDTVPRSEEKGEVTYVHTGHDVEHVTEVHKNPHPCVIHQRNIRDELRMKIGVQITAAKVTQSGAEARDGN